MFWAWVSNILACKCRAIVNGDVFWDTTQRGKPVVFPFKSRPFTGGINAGVEEALASMKVGGKRRVIIPPSMGFGNQPYALRGTRHVKDKEGVVPPNSTLEYELELVRVSIPPS
jgi:FKBP-type peptidyl-prolyl cis-trans isomerase